MGNSEGVVGVNPNARIMAIKAGSGQVITFEGVIYGIRFARENGAKIINASFGIKESAISSTGLNNFLDLF